MRLCNCTNIKIMTIPRNKLIDTSFETDIAAIQGIMDSLFESLDDDQPDYPFAYYEVCITKCRRHLNSMVRHLKSVSDSDDPKNYIL